MKMKVVLASVAVVAIAVVAFAFTSKKATKDYYYISGTDDQRLQPGLTNQLDSRENTITSANFTDVLNWTATPQSFTQSSDYSKYIGKINFDEETTADGGSDGQLTLQEALTAVYNQYSAPNPDVMQSSFTVDGSAVVTITAATLAH